MGFIYIITIIVVFYVIIDYSSYGKTWFLTWDSFHSYLFFLYGFGIDYTQAQVLACNL